MDKDEIKTEEQRCYEEKIKELDGTYYYEKEDLGASWSQEGTEFRVWSPLADAIQVCLYPTGNDTGAEQEFPMERQTNGVWYRTVSGDLEGHYYTYRVCADGKIEETQDIYGKACGVNGNRSMIVDLARTNPEGWEADHRVSPDGGPVIYELHIKDFSNQPESGVSEQHRGKYLAFCEEETTFNGAEAGTPTGLNYLKKLGVTDIHLLPFFDYGSIDESDRESNAFNWGYDPVNYLCPEGSYSTDALDGHVRILEVKKMIQSIHKAGMGVIMDVVFNHTYRTDSAFQKTVPGYYYRMNKDGLFTNGSGCGNETASEHRMYRKYMVDAVCYWAREYHLDGFRFDLMGLHDVETMNDIRRALNELPGGSDILMYGEPWQAGASGMNPEAVPAVKKNLSLLDAGIAIFNDDTRDCIKGTVMDARGAGYINGDPSKGHQIPSVVRAWCDGEGGYRPRTPFQTISYVSAHDNVTLWDKLCAVAGQTDYQQMDEELLKQNKMAAGIIFTSLGIPFFQAGEEFGRTKGGIEDSYASPAEVNQLDWIRASQWKELVDYYRELIALRRSFSVYQERTMDVLEQFSFEAEHPEEELAISIRGLAEEEEWSEWYVIYHNREEDAMRRLPEGTWIILCDGVRADRDGIGEAEDEILLKAKSMTILGKH